tara:strand:- start:7336 stop:8403 length:1068 start_codon:yes stop_codon:yes gene_type:complete
MHQALTALPLAGDNSPILFGNGHSDGSSAGMRSTTCFEAQAVYLGEPFSGDIRKGYMPSYNAHSIFYKCFSLSTIRNPFDMLPSMFFYNLKNHPDDKDLTIKTFDEFVHNFCNNRSHFSDKKYHEEDKNYVISNHSAFKRFLFFQLFSHDTVCQVDAILPIEKIENGLRDLFKNADFLKDLNIDEGVVQPDGGTIREHKDYRRYYTPKLVDMINNKFKREIEFFGYDFEDGYRSDITVIDPSTFTYDMKYDLLIYSHNKVPLFPQWSHSISRQAISFKDSVDINLKLSQNTKLASYNYTPGLLKNSHGESSAHDLSQGQSAISHQYDHMRASIWASGKDKSEVFCDGPASFTTYV